MSHQYGDGGQTWGRDDITQGVCQGERHKGRRKGPIRKGEMEEMFSCSAYFSTYPPPPPSYFYPSLISTLPKVHTLVSKSLTQLTISWYLFFTFSFFMKSLSGDDCKAIFRPSGVLQPNSIQYHVKPTYVTNGTPNKASTA